MKMVALRANLLLTTLSISLATLTVGCNGPDIRGPYSGEIVEAESQKPIAGAVVVVVWTYAMHGGGREIDAKEAVTDRQGRWAIPARPTHIGEGGIGGVTRKFYVFAAGYDVLDPRGTPRDDRVARETSVTTMRPVSRAEQCNGFRAGPSVYGEQIKIPRYLAAVANTRQELGC